jgi:deoxyribonuclease-4
MAVRRAAAANMRSVQIFTAIPRFYGDKTSIKADRVARFRKALDETGIRAENVMVHGAYVVNVATPDPETWSRAAAGLAREMERSTAIGAGMVCFHPGSHKGSPEDAAERVANAMTLALRGVEGGTRLLVENAAGTGRTFGRTAEEVALILSHLPDDVRARAGYGLDTCHLYASGYNLAESRETAVGVLDAFESATGEIPSFLHFNDSEGALASNKDRHALIGKGKIGAEAFGWLLHDSRSKNVPVIMETPQENGAVADDDDTPDTWDVQSLALLRALARGA